LDEEESEEEEVREVSLGRKRFEVVAVAVSSARSWRTGIVRKVGGECDVGGTLRQLLDGRKSKK
jgi:hypothetical protein